MPALGHDGNNLPEKYTVIEPATCTEDGTARFYTTFTPAASKQVLVADFIVTIPALGHNFDTENWTEGETTYWHTCLNEGCTEKLAKKITPMTPGTATRTPTRSSASALSAATLRPTPAT